MKKKDLLWIGTIAAFAIFLTFPTTHKLFIEATGSHPYLMGFVKFSILATMGELLAIRIAAGDYKKPVGLLYRFLVWGILGMAFAVVFPLFAGGVTACMSKGLLPNLSIDTVAGKFVFAFFTSTFMNVIFGPTFMAFHRVTDTFIDLSGGNLSKIPKIKLSEVIKKIDWNGFISFVVLKTIPFFWIPAHTITFLLPDEYRVLMAAFLSIALGILLSTAKLKSNKNA